MIGRQFQQKYIQSNQFSVGRIKKGRNNRTITKNQSVLVSHYEPATLIDWVKLVWMKLCKGNQQDWLFKPNMIAVNSEVDQQLIVHHHTEEIHEIYFNVIPTETLDNNITLAYEDKYHQLIHNPTDIDWLTMVPPTSETLQQVDNEVKKQTRKLKSSYLLYNSMKENGNWRSN